MFGKLIPHKEHRQSDLKRRTDENFPLARLRREFDDLWDRFLEEGRSDGMSLWSDTAGLSSSVDWDEKEAEYVVRAEMPGFEPEDIDVKITGNVLTLHAEHREEGDEKGGGYRRYGSFYESFTLPQDIRDEEIDARYHNGVLELHLPKSEVSEAKRIDVKAS